MLSTWRAVLPRATDIANDSGDIMLLPILSLFRVLSKDNELEPELLARNDGVENSELCESWSLKLFLQLTAKSIQTDGRARVPL